MTVEQLIARDGAVCVWCGREPWPADLTLLDRIGQPVTAPGDAG